MALQTGAESAAAPFFPMEHWVRQAKTLGPISDLQTFAEFPGGDQVRTLTDGAQAVRSLSKNARLTVYYTRTQSDSIVTK